MIEAHATAKYVRTSAQKAGLVLDQIRGRDVNHALATLQVHAEVGGARHRKGAAVGHRQRAAERRLWRRRRPAVRERLLRQPGPVGQACASCADGAGVSSRQALGALDRARDGAAGGDRERRAVGRTRERSTRKPAAGAKRTGAASAPRARRSAPKKKSERDVRQRSATWVRKFIRTGSGSDSTRRGGRGGSRSRLREAAPRGSAAA